MLIVKVILCIILLAPVAAFVIALILAVRSTGGKRWLAWGNFVLMFLPPLVAVVGGVLLAEKGLEWRSNVKMALGLIFTCGVLGLFIRVGIFLVCRTERWNSLAGTLASCTILLVGSILCIGIFLYGFLFTVMWSGSDCIVVVRGEHMVEETEWEGRNYYAYHGPFVRGTELLEGSDDLKKQAKREEKYRQDAAARETAAKALDLDIPSGVVDIYTDTHEGFHNDGMTFIKMRFSDVYLLWGQVKDNPKWSAMPGPEELSALAGLVTGENSESLFPDLSAMGDMDRYYFLDRFRGVENVSDTKAALERGAYNFTLAVYDFSEETLYFCQLDT